MQHRLSLPADHRDALHFYHETGNRKAGDSDQRTRRKALLEDLLAELHKAVADFSQDNYPVASAIEGNAGGGWAVSPAFGATHRAVFQVKEPAGFAGGTLLTFTLDQHFPGKDHNIGKYRISVSTAKGAIPLEGLPDAVGKVLAIAPEKRTPEQKASVASYFASTDAELARLRNEFAAHPLPGDRRLLGAQDLAWALINSPAFLFNH